MACRWTTVTAALTCLASLWHQGDAQTCRGPQLASGTRHNGTAVEYPPGAVLSYSCDTGYKLNYKSSTSRCTQSSGQSPDLSWNPPDIKCDLDIVSLAVAVVVALVGIIVFIMAMVWLAKRRKVTGSREIKRKARDNIYDHYQPRGSSKQNGQVNQGMESIEMETRGTAIGGNDNGNVISKERSNGQANALLWSPPRSRGSVMQDSETAVLQRSRKSSATSRSSRTDNMAADSTSGVQLKPDYGDVEFGAGGAHFQNFKDIGSSMASFANPSMPRLNNMDTSLPMPDASNPSMIAEGDTSPDSGGDFSDLYASVDISKKKNKRGSKVNNNNSNVNNGVTVATIESDGAYSTIGSHSPPSGSFSAHEEALADNGSGYSEMKIGNDYSEVNIKEITPGENPDFDSLYAKVVK